MAFTDFFKPLKIKAPELTYFDHLLGEYESLVAAPPAPAYVPRGSAAQPAAQPAGADGQTDALAAATPDADAQPPAAESAAGADADIPRAITGEAKRLVESLTARRNDGTLGWNDLYLFEMLLADVRPVGTLRSKVLSLRRDYRNVAGQVEYDEYLASKPKNLLDPPDPRDPPDAGANYETLLRDDLKDLLGRLFKRYAILPVREARLKRLTVSASILCFLFLVVLLIIIILIGAPPGAGLRLPSIALFVVLVSGAMGGFVSALQRIQSSPTEGDSIYNLSMLYHGSYAVFVAPLTGAIFAILLYMMFTGKILEGRFFPDVYTPSAATMEAASAPTPSPTPTPQTDANLAPAAAAPTRTPAPARTPRPTPQPDANANLNANVNANINANSNASADNENAGGVNTNSNAAARAPAEPTPTPRPVPKASLGVRSFLYESGPAGGQDYALLVIWSFIAGFAERFVPDSLNRLIAGRQGGGQPGS